MLKNLAQNRARLMPWAACAGFLLPSVADILLPILPQVLFVLMLLTLLTLDVKAMSVRLKNLEVWRFACFHVGAITVLGTMLAYVLFYAFGVRGQWLLMVAGVLASAPLFGSGAVVSAIGFDAKDAMAKTIAATLVMPIVLLGVLFCFADGASLDWGVYIRRLLGFIVAPIVLAFVLKKIAAKPIAHAQAWISWVNFVVLLLFPFGLVGSFRHLIDHNLMLGMQVLLLGIVLTVVPFFFTYWVYRKHAMQTKITHALLAGGCNMLLAYAISTPHLGSLFIALTGAMQLPIFCLAMVAKRLMGKRYAR